MTKRNGRKRPETIRCAIYTRKSHEDGLEQDFNSLDAQREAGEAYVASQKGEGWMLLPDRYDDGGFSGGNVERPALRRLIADIEAGRVDCVVVYKVDRLSRSLFDFAGLVELFERKGVSFVSVTQHFNTTDSMGRLTLNILLSFAQFEREIIGERIRDKIAAQRRRGKWTGGTPILGYDVDRSGNSPKLVVNAAEAARVRKIFGLYLKLGSLLPVVQELAKRTWANKAWRTRKGEPKGGRLFDKSSLYALLTNPLLVGRIKHKDEVHEGEHESIVPNEVFEEVGRRLAANGRNGGGDVRNKHGALLKGMLVCRACGRMMTHTFTKKGQKRYRYYRCTRAIQNGCDQCPTGSLPAAEIERAVVDEVRVIATDERLRAEVLSRARAQVEAGLESLRTEERDLVRELGRHHTELRKLATETDDAATRRTADLQDAVDRASTRLAEVRARIEEAGRETLDEADLAAALDNFDGVWAELSPRERARLLALLVAKVEYDVGRGTIAVSFYPTGIRALAKGGAA